ncbi:zinc finger, CCHC-type containing protein [Tanacetum coccineum]|uniref:Zinc finger, CCHC-type containing protein n=1 Tax=Tanacetum coccineum TaxID=301880 RepID=A0ABQ5IXL2_9ASTR
MTLKGQGKLWDLVRTCGSLSKETGSSSRLDDEVVQDKRQRDDNGLQDERQDQTEEEEVEPRRSKRARNEKSFGPDFVSFMVENEHTSYREAVTSSEGQQCIEAIKKLTNKIIRSTKDMLKSKFDMKDMGLDDGSLGNKIIRTQNGTCFKSRTFRFGQILNTHNAGDSNQARTSIDTSLHLSKNRGLVSRLSRYTSNPSYGHWKAITRIRLVDMCFTRRGALFGSSSKQYYLLAKSTMESEFIALDNAREEAEWLRQFVEDIPRWPKLYNSNNTESALAVSAFGSASGGTQSIANSVFNSTIYEGVLAESFNTGSDVIEHIESGLKG